MAPLLEASGVSKSFGGLQALRRVDFAVEAGAIAGLIGPNGAGKTTMFNCITGAYRPDQGTIVLRSPDGEHRLDRAGPDRATRFGVCRTFQNIRLFGNMTAAENVMVGRHIRTREGVLGAVLRGRGFLREEAATVAKAAELLDFVGLSGKGEELAKNLAYGDMRRLEIARALATEPVVLLLDEPTAGMNTVEKTELMGLVRAIRDGGLTIVVIEHDMRFVMGICDRVTVLDHGERIAEGEPAQVQRDPIVIEAYLGTDTSGTRAAD